MVDSSFLQTSFLGGEWSPFVQGHVDDPRYATGLNYCENYFPIDEGALVRRPGMFMTAWLTTAADNVRLIPYKYTEAVTYMLEFTAGETRVYANDTLATYDPQTITSITDGTPEALFTIAAHGLADGDQLYVIPASGSTAYALRNRIFIVDNATANTFTLVKTGAQSGDLAFSEISGYTTGTIRQIVVLDNPYSDNQITSLHYAQDVGELYVYHAAHEPLVHTRTALDAIFTVADMSFLDGPYLEKNATATTLTPSATTGSVTVTASSTAGINNGTGFQTTDVGRVIRIGNASNAWGWGRITARASTTSITVLVSSAFPSTSAVTHWRLGLYSDTTGWPASGALHEGRHYIMGSSIGNRIDGSIIGAVGSQRNLYSDFTPTAMDGTVSDANAVSYVLDALDNNRINWAASDAGGLIVGTLSGEWIIRASANDDPLTATSFQARKVTSHGNASIQPVQAQGALIFAQKLRRTIYEYYFSSYTTKYQASDVTKSWKHLTEGGIKRLAYLTEPVSTVWSLHDDGTLAGCAYSRGNSYMGTGEDAYAGAFRVLCDAGTDQDTAPFIKDIATLQSPDGLSDQLWTATRRTIGAATITTIEVMVPVFNTQTHVEDGFFVGDGIKYSSANFEAMWDWTNVATGEFTFAGLWHIEGLTVDVGFRGYDLGSYTVTNGTIVVSVPDGLMLAPVDEDYQGTESRPISFVLTPDDAYITTAQATEAITPAGPIDPVPTGGTTINTTTDHNGHGFMVGEDNKKYFMYAVGAVPDNFAIKRVEVGDDAIIDGYSTDQYGALAAANAVDGGYTCLSVAAVPLVNTPYFIAIGLHDTAEASPHANARFHSVLLMKINASGTTEVVGGFGERTENTVTHLPRTSPDTLNDILAATIAGTGSTAEPIYVIYKGDSLQSNAGLLLTLPSLDSTDWNFAVDDTGDPWNARCQALDSYWDDNFFSDNLLTGRQRPNNRFWFAPYYTGALWETWLFSYIGKAEVAAHVADPGNTNASSYVNGLSGANPNGFVSCLKFNNSGAPYSVINANSLFGGELPFADVGLNKDNTTGVAGDDYLAPTPMISDAMDLTSNRYFLWPRVYYGQSPDLEPIGSYVTVRVFEWDVNAGSATLVTEGEGPWFDPVVDLGYSESGRYTSNPKTIITYGLGTEVFLAGLFTGVNSSVGDRWVFGKFGDMDSGVVDFDLTSVAVGFGYRSRAQLLRPEGGAATGLASGKKRRIDQGAFLVYRTGAFDAGTSFDHLFEVPVRVEGETAFRTPLFSGYINASLGDTHSFDGMIAFEQTRPVPGNFVAIAGMNKVQDR